MGSLVGGISALLIGLILIFDDNFRLHGVIRPSWTGWPILITGFIVCYIALKALWRERGKPKPEPPPITDEEFAKLETELDAAYLREYGEPPEKPKQPEKKQ